MDMQYMKVVKRSKSVPMAIGKKIQPKVRRQLYNAQDQWVGEWVSGEKPLYYYGEREDRERTMAQRRFRRRILGLGSQS